MKRVFILGPSHHVRLSGCAVSACAKYATPFYNLNIDRAINEELMATGEFEVMTLEADEDEHSIEVSLAAQLVEECEVPRGNQEMRRIHLTAQVGFIDHIYK